MSEKPPVSRNMRITQCAMIGLFLAFLSLMAYGPLMKSAKASPRTNQIHNCKQIFMALNAFALDHDGLFPCDKTGLANTAEDCFNQLLSGGYLDNENIFWCPNCANSGVVVKNIPNNDGVLTADENCWGYVKGFTTKSPTHHPILFDSSTEVGVFNTSVWEGKAIVSKLNGSVKALRISKVNNASNQKNEGYILERREGIIVDIFQELPQGSTVLAPQLAR